MLCLGFTFPIVNCDGAEMRLLFLVFVLNYVCANITLNFRLALRPSRSLKKDDKLLT